MFLVGHMPDMFALPRGVSNPVVGSSPVAIT